MSSLFFSHKFTSKITYCKIKFSHHQQTFFSLQFWLKNILSFFRFFGSSLAWERWKIIFLMMLFEKKARSSKNVSSWMYVRRVYAASPKLFLLTCKVSFPSFSSPHQKLIKERRNDGSLRENCMRKEAAEVLLSSCIYISIVTRDMIAPSVNSFHI